MAWDFENNRYDGQGEYIYKDLDETKIDQYGYETEVSQLADQEWAKELGRKFYGLKFEGDKDGRGRPRAPWDNKFILAYKIQGLDNYTIAERLGLSRRTVDKRVCELIKEGSWKEGIKPLYPKLRGVPGTLERWQEENYIDPLLGYIGGDMG